MGHSFFPNSETIRRHQLPNGITILLYHNPASRAVVVQGSVQIGHRTSRATAGLASLTASCLMRGSANYSFEQIYEEMESIGANLGYSAGYTRVTFSAEALIEDEAFLLALLADTIRRPTFPQKHIEKVRSEYIASLQMRENNTQSMANLRFYEELYREHPYGISTRGYLDSISTLHRDDVATFHANYYTPQKMILTVVGGINPDKTLEKIIEQFGDWTAPQQNEAPPISAATAPVGIIRTHFVMPNKTQSDVMMGLPGPDRHNPRFLEAQVANTILGVFGMMGRLGKNVRERQGLAYYVRSVLSGGSGPLPWYVSTGVAPQNVETAITSIREEIWRLQQQPVSAEELEDTKAYLTGSLPMGVENNGGIGSRLYSMELFDLGLDYLMHYPNLINRITIEDVQAAAQDYFSADNIVIAVAGPHNV